jgi:hypothetical protein
LRRSEATFIASQPPRSAPTGNIPVAVAAGSVQTGQMGRTVSALVTWDDAYLGAIGPVAALKAR